MRERLNLRVFIGMMAAVVLLAAGVLLLHRFQVRRNAPELRALARAAEEKGRPDRAARLLGQYLNFAPQDTKAKADYTSLLARFAATPGMRRAAADLCEEVLVAEPDNHEVRRRLARLQMAQGHYEDALANLWRLRDDSPKDADLAFQVAFCQEGSLNYAEAAEEYHRLTSELAPDCVVAYLRRANLLRFRLSDPRGADKCLDEMVAANPANYQAYLFRAQYQLALRKGNPEEDLRQAREWAALPVFGAGVGALTASAQGPGPVAVASALVAGMYRLAPQTADVLLTSAEAARLEYHVPEALGHLRSALEAYPDDARVYQALAVLEAGAGARAEAITHLWKGLARLPGNRALLFTLASLLIEGRDFEKAEKVVRELERWKPPPQHLALVKAELSMARGEWKEASKALEDNRSLLAADSPDLVIHADLLLGRCYERLGEGDQAWSAYRRAVGGNPQNIGAQAALAQVLVHLGRTDEAVGQYRRLLARTDAGREAWVAYARLLVSREHSLPAGTRQWQEVEKNLEKVAERVPDDAQIALLRAEVFAAQGKGSEAQRVLQGAAARHPNLVVALVQCRLAQGQVKEAEEVVREAKQQWGDTGSQVPPGEVMGARRALATYLAEAGHEPLFREAVELIDQNLAAAAGNAAEVYAKVRILGSRPSHRKEALALLRQLGRSQHLSFGQVVYLAWLYLGTGNGSEAESVINNYVRAEKTTAEDRLACVRSAAEVFEQFAQESPEAGQALGPVAEKMYRTAAEGSGRPEDLLALAGYLGRRRRTQDALALCFDQAREKCPPEGVAAAVTAIVCAAPASEEQLTMVEGYLGDCVEKNPGSPVLRKLLAIVQARRGRYAEAAASYRAVLKQSARDVDALNNLALMLALQKGRPAESLALLEKAVWLAGTTAGLLDTRGMVHLHAGELGPAVRDFREAVAQAPTPVRHLHLAQACLRAGRREEAQRAFTKARAAGVEHLLVLPAEQEAYALLGPELANR